MNIDLLLVKIANSDFFSGERQNHIFKWWSKKQKKANSLDLVMAYKLRKGYFEKTRK